MKNHSTLKFPYAFALVSVLGLAACGGGGGETTSEDTTGEDTSTVETASGVFVDSTVSGLSYESGGQTGTTNPDGGFTYEIGQPVTFSIGGVTVGEATGQSVITPVDLVENGITDSPEVQNIARFLLMLDRDGNSTNGIEISSAVQLIAETWEQVDFSSTDLATELASIIDDANSVDGTTHVLPEAANARAHLESTLRCVYSGAFRGTYTGDSTDITGAFGLLVDSRNGFVNGVMYSNFGSTDFLSGTTPISYDQDPTFVSEIFPSTGGTYIGETAFSGTFTTPDQVSGSWTSSVLSRTFSGSRIGGVTGAAYRATGLYEGDDFGLFSFDVDESDNITGLSYSVLEVEVFALTGELSDGSISATASDGTQITGTFVKATGVLCGSWENTAEGLSGTFLGSGCGLNASTVDPMATSPAWTAEGDQVGAFFGNSVAGAGDVNGDGYGDVIVGAWGYDNSELDEGRAFVYLGSALGLSATPAWTAEGDQIDADLGTSVAGAGDVNGDGYDDVIVGARDYDNGDTEGRAFVYLGSASGLSATPAWTAEGDQVGAFFGNSVAGAGDVNGDGYGDVIVGAQWYDNDEGYEGRALLYLGSASGLSATPAWTAESDQFFAWFGTSVAGAGDVNKDGYGDVIVGAHYYDNGETDEGRAYLYLGSALGVSEMPAWTAEGDQVDANFGYSVAGAGDVNGDGYDDVIVGAYWYDNGEAAEGQALVYYGSAAGLASTPAWTAEGDQVGAKFGFSVAGAGDVNGDGYGDVIVGAHTFDYAGRAFVYSGSASGISATPAWTAEGDQVSELFGTSVAGAGDVNGDGYGDVIVGAPWYENGETDEGRAYLYLGSALPVTCAY